MCKQLINNVMETVNEIKYPFLFRFLCLQNIITANVVFFKYTAQHPDFSGLGPPYQKPLLNFVWFLLLVIERFVLLLVGS